MPSPSPGVAAIRHAAAPATARPHAPADPVRWPRNHLRRRCRGCWLSLPRRWSPAPVAHRGRSALSIDGRTARRVAITLVPLVALALAVEAVGARDNVGTYERLLPSVSTAADDPRFGPPVPPDATTQGLLLSPAVAAGDGDTRRTARAWLDSARSAYGWGTPATSDLSGDGSPKPASTPFARATAFAINGLLDDGMDPETARDIRVILVWWARDAWSDGSIGFRQCRRSPAMSPAGARCLPA